MVVNFGLSRHNSSVNQPDLPSFIVPPVSMNCCTNVMVSDCRYVLSIPLHLPIYFGSAFLSFPFGREATSLILSVTVPFLWFAILPRCLRIIFTSLYVSECKLLYLRISTGLLNIVLLSLILLLKLYRQFLKKVAAKCMQYI